MIPAIFGLRTKVLGMKIETANFTVTLMHILIF